MALSKSKGPVYTKYNIPLFGSKDSRWVDNTWIVEHLRQLANTIEEEQPNIYRVGIDMDAQYKSPALFLECFESRESEKIGVPEWRGENVEKFANLCVDLEEVIKELDDVSDLGDYNKFHQHDKLCEKHGVSRQDLNWFLHQFQFGVGPDMLTRLMLSQKTEK
jgi:hypothetical protein